MRKITIKLRLSVSMHAIFGSDCMDLKLMVYDKTELSTFSTKSLEVFF